MQKRNAPNKKKSFLIIYITFFLLFSIPLVIWGTQNGSFDIRNRAFDDITVSDENPCVISLPNVNPYTLDVGKSITVQVDAQLSDAAIASLSITDSTGASIYQETFNTSPISISTSFKFTPQKSGTVDLLGAITKVGGGSVACKISSTYDVLGLRAMEGNQAPTFTSLPTASKPSQDIKTGEDYEYTLTATDPDGDRINYSYSFTPKADWLKATVIQDGAKGTLSIKFQGSTTQAASYLANVFIHDGYSKHLSSQAWVISVSPAENDIPIVRILKPTTFLSVDNGAIVQVTWDASDLNAITNYAIYLSQNPTDESSWITVNDNVSSKITSYSIDTTKLEAGIYKVIVKATDNQNPSLSGLGISNDIIVNGGSTEKDDDVVVLEQPQIINMTPISTDTISNKQVMIKATLIAGENSEIDTKSIVFKLDDADLSNEVSINKISTQEATVIYQPQSDLASGLHKVDVTFEDKNNQTANKSWTFTIASDQTVQEGYISIFGLEISQRTLIIIGVGILVVIIAIVAPIIIFSVWKEEQKKQDDESDDNYVIPTIQPSSPIPPVEPTTNIVEALPNPKIPVEEVTSQSDIWDKYSAPKPKEQENASVTPVVEDTQIGEKAKDESKVTVPEMQEVIKDNILNNEKVEDKVTNVLKEDSVPDSPITPLQQAQPVAVEISQTPVSSTITPNITTEIPQPDIPNMATATQPIEETKPDVSNTQTPTAEVSNTPQANSILPPEPDLDNDVEPDEDLTAIYEQIQKAQEDNSTPNS